MVLEDEDNSVFQPRHHLVIYAGSWITAQKALNLIHGSHQLQRGEPEIFPVHPIAHNDKEPENLDETERHMLAGRKYSTGGLPLACAIAAKASRRRKWSYSVSRYKFSMSTYSLHVVDLDPRLHPLHLSVSKFPCDHVMFSYAILSAYSVIEDLGLEVRASHKKPSRLRGAWNPEVKEDLESRLSRAKIDLGENLLWTVRGTRRRIEAGRSLPAGSKAHWAKRNIRDTKIPLIDAIAYAAWLRSKVAAHTVKDTTLSLSPYDAINVQHVARRLLLETMGFWRYHEHERDRLRKQNG